MAKAPANQPRKWTAEEVEQLKQLVRENTPTRVIALKMDRTETSVKGKAAREKISLKPANRSPYSRRERGSSR
jgi:hypothetical protein